MAHLYRSLPATVELGAVRSEDWGTEAVKTDDGGEVRNNRWSQPLRSYDVAFPAMRRTDTVYLAVKDLWEAAAGGLNTFDFTDWTDESGNTKVRVRFATPLQITGVDKDLDHIDTLTLVEIRT